MGARRCDAVAVSGLPEVVPGLLRRGAHVTDVELCGSRARGDAGHYSDWDFAIRTDDLAMTATELPLLVEPLNPLLQQWDRLGDTPCYMLMLTGPTKVDLIFAGHPHADEPPWTVTAETLAGIDAHFWDWTLWLASKVAAGKTDRVAGELQKMFDHLLAPMGAGSPPTSFGDAIDIYLGLRRERQRGTGVVIDEEPGRLVLRAVGPLTGT
jgi:predicted nucleotidyltransferase